MADKIMYNPNDDTQKYPFCRLKLFVETFEHSTQWINQLILNLSSKTKEYRFRNTKTTKQISEHIKL